MQNKKFIIIIILILIILSGTLYFYSKNKTQINKREEIENTQSYIDNMNREENIKEEDFVPIEDSSLPATRGGVDTESINADLDNALNLLK